MASRSKPRRPSPSRHLIGPKRSPTRLLSLVEREILGHPPDHRVVETGLLSGGDDIALHLGVTSESPSPT